MTIQCNKCKASMLGNIVYLEKGKLYSKCSCGHINKCRPTIKNESKPFDYSDLEIVPDDEKDSMGVILG